MRLRQIPGYLFWRLVLTKPRVFKVLSRLLLPDHEEFVTFGFALVFIHCQQELGLYRAARAASRIRYLHHEMPMLQVLLALVKPHMTFVDCGANVGSWSANVASMSPVIPDLKVIAFEPHPATFARLLKSTERYPNVECHNLALSDCRRRLELAEGAGSQTFGVAKSHFQIKELIHQVDAWPLDNFLVDTTQLLIKIDVEGHEYEVLRGTPHTLASGRVRGLFIDGCDPEYRERIVANLRSHGFDLRDLRTLHPLSENQDRILALGDTVRLSEGDDQIKRNGRVPMPQTC
jgi:FkbM family methyltransferase